MFALPFTRTFRTLLLGTLLTSLLTPCYAASVLITGAGATFPYPLYARWAESFEEQTGNQVNYQSIGSGGGIQQIIANTVDFGASDKPLDANFLSSNQLIQFPTVVGGVVPIINVAGVDSGQLKLSPDVLAGIFLKQITHWNDPQIQALNPHLILPNQPITVIHRSDGSGSTFLFTHYLSQISPIWNKQVGADTSVDWPVGIGGKGNEGVAAYVQQIDGSIGYVEYAYATENELPVALLENKDGYYVLPTLETFGSAASNANWQTNNNFSVILTNEPGENTWPITGATFILIHNSTDNPAKTKVVLQFFDWALHSGGDQATQLNYVPLPQSVVKMIENTWSKGIKDKQAKNIWP